jgi:dCMP deaminase
MDTYDSVYMKFTEKVRKNREWDLYFLKLAEVICTKSSDTSTKVGAVVIGPDNEIRTTGYNGFPRGVEYTRARIQRPEKYFWFEHAERNAIFNAARMGTSLKDCTMYITSISERGKGIAPCAECCRAIIQSGIKRVVMLKERAGTLQKQEEGERAFQMLHEAGVQISYINE